jgi:hypothetical protein
MNGTCQSACVPSCEDASCGDDGCGGSCGGCPTGFDCAISQCVLDRSHLWQLVAVNGLVADFPDYGGSWDLLGGAPDPQVCVTVSAITNCTAVAHDTYVPEWGSYGTILAEAPASVFRGGILTELLDVDPYGYDTICSGPWEFSDSAFKESAGTIAACDWNTSSWSFHLIPRNH